LSEKKGLSKASISSHQSSINRFVTWLEKQEVKTIEDGGLAALQKAFQKHIQQFKKTASKNLKWKVGTINYKLYLMAMIISKTIL
jgi:site-specific recombinase XerD